MNTIILRRVNIGSDAVVKVHEDQTVIEFSVADNKKFKNLKGEACETSSWFNCSMWTKNTTLADFLKKGSSVNVIGKLTAGAYTNKQGEAKPDLKVTVFEVDLLDRKEKTENETAPAPEAVQEKTDDDLPF